MGEIRDIHDRMPCVLKLEAYSDWLEKLDVRGLMELLNVFCVDDFVISRV